ncbi:uncharacterized protein LOC135824715 [Sycon ciliatum]|uniref:uncharacterized protein LOC135824715 n=1 Tax=Sycon ciliatum TaxID=27933 RepID=UPI0031F64373
MAFGQDRKQSYMRYVSCFGCPMLDLVAPVDEAFLQKYELTADGNVMVDADRARVFDGVKALDGVSKVVGGAAQNTARVCQWALKSLTCSSPLGSRSSTVNSDSGVIAAQCVSVGCVGDDENGRQIASGTERDGVRVAYAVHATLSTGVCAALITGETRSLVSNYGAWMQYPGEHLDSIWNDIVEQSHIIYASGYFVQSCEEAARRLCRHVDCHGDTVMLCVNLSAEYVCLESSCALLSVIQSASVVFGNYDEACVLAKTCNFWEEGDDIESLACKLANVQPHSTDRACVCSDGSDSKRTADRTIVLTQGQKPVVVCSRAGRATSTVHSFPVATVDKLVDTNGAGDAFVAGYLCGLVYNMPSSKCVSLATECARYIVQEVGCTIPDRQLEFAL